MKPLTDFLPEVMPGVIGCPMPMVLNAVRNSVIEFLAKSGLREQTVTIALVPEVASYPLIPATGTALQALLRGRVDGVLPVTPSVPAQMDSSNANWRLLKGSQPTHALVENGALTVCPVPGEAAVLAVTFTETLSRTAMDVPDELVSDWLEEIAAGALARLLAAPNVAWSNPELALYHKGQFKTAIEEARIQKMRGGTDASLCVSPRAFG